MRFDHAPHVCAATRSLIVLALSFTAMAGGCGRATSGEPRQRSETVPIPGLMGAWEWAQSTGGALGDTVTREMSGRSYHLKFLPGDRYVQASSTDSVSNGSYTSASGGTFNQPNSVFPVLRFDHPLFNGYFGPVEEYAVVIRGDTLELEDTYSHAWVHRYLRATGRQP